MKRLSLFALLSFIVLSIAFSIILMSFKGTNGRGGTHFMEWKWSDVEHQAEIRNKPIFVFVGASYCNISARMNFTFRQKEVGAILNDNFVCNKMFSDEGLMNNLRAISWGVTTVPTYLFFNTKGKLVYKAEGYKDKDNMLSEIQTALQKINESK